jgi:hypothetical protein
MKIDPKTLIAGLLPAVLKRLFKLREFDLQTFAKTTGVARADAPAKVIELIVHGWIVPHPSIRDLWETTELGDRLSATPLLPAIQVARARELVRQVVAAADAVNADQSHFYIVERLALFGSVVEAPVGGTVGDIDVGYQLGLRELDDAKKENLLKLDGETRPRSYWPWYAWPEERVRRRLRVGLRVSLHLLQEVVSLGIDPTVFYLWDRDAGRGKVTLPW